MTLFKRIEDELKTALNILKTNEIDTSKVTVEPPRDLSHGDLATNAAMVLCKQLGEKPRDLAEKISNQLTQSDLIDAAEIAGPGFINLRLNPNCYYDDVLNVIAQGTNIGNLNLGENKKICVEYVSVNPTGPLHVGHVRGAVVGDALCNLLAKAGYQVTREYYINDAGNQINILAQSTYLRYKEALGEDIGEIPEGLYPGEYLIEPAKELAETYGDQWLGADEAEYLPVIKPYITDKMMDLIRADLDLLDIHHNVFSSEKELTSRGIVEEAVETLDKLGLVYTGTLPPPKGQEPDDNWEPVELLLFKSSEFGDDEDRALKKPDGSWTYTTPDIAYHHDKAKRGHDILVTVVGSDHKGWVKRIKAAVTAVTEGSVTFEPMLTEMVNFLKDGQPFKFSKRANNIVGVPDLLELVEPGAVRFIMLTRKNEQVLDFDFSKVSEASKDNPVFYVQYAHARCCSVMKHAAEMFNADEITDEALAKIDLSSLGADEMDVIKTLINWPRIVEQAATAFEPHRIAFYVQEVASAFHSWWNKGKDDATLRFLIEDNKELTLARLALIRAVAITIASALEIIGVKPLTEMRSEISAEEENAA